MNITRLLQGMDNLNNAVFHTRGVFEHNGLSLDPWMSPQDSDEDIKREFYNIAESIKRIEERLLHIGYRAGKVSLTV